MVFGRKKRKPMSRAARKKQALTRARRYGPTAGYDEYEPVGDKPGKGKTPDPPKSGGRKKQSTSKGQGASKAPATSGGGGGNKPPKPPRTATASPTPEPKGGKGDKGKKSTPPNSVSGGGRQAAPEFLLPESIRQEKGYADDLSRLKKLLASGDVSPRDFVERFERRKAAALADQGPDPEGGGHGRNRAAQRQVARMQTLGEDAGILDKQGAPINKQDGEDRLELANRLKAEFEEREHDRRTRSLGTNDEATLAEIEKESDEDKAQLDAYYAKVKDRFLNMRYGDNDPAEVELNDIVEDSPTRVPGGIFTRMGNDDDGLDVQAEDMQASRPTPDVDAPDDTPERGDIDAPERGDIDAPERGDIDADGPVDDLDDFDDLEDFDDLDVFDDDGLNLRSDGMLTRPNSDPGEDRPDMQASRDAGMQAEDMQAPARPAPNDPDFDEHADQSVQMANRGNQKFVEDPDFDEHADQSVQMANRGNQKFVEDPDTGEILDRAPDVRGATPKRFGTTKGYEATDAVRKVDRAKKQLDDARVAYQRDSKRHPGRDHSGALKKVHQAEQRMLHARRKYQEARNSEGGIDFKAAAKQLTKRQRHERVIEAQRRENALRNGAGATGERRQSAIESVGNTLVGHDGQAPPGHRNARHRDADAIEGRGRGRATTPPAEPAEQEQDLDMQAEDMQASSDAGIQAPETPEAPAPDPEMDRREAEARAILEMRGQNTDDWDAPSESVAALMDEARARVRQQADERATMLDNTHRREAEGRAVLEARGVDTSDWEEASPAVRKRMDAARERVAADMNRTPEGARLAAQNNPDEVRRREAANREANHEFAPKEQRDKFASLTDDELDYERDQIQQEWGSALNEDTPLDMPDEAIARDVARERLDGIDREIADRQVENRRIAADRQPVTDDHAPDADVPLPEEPIRGEDADTLDNLSRLDDRTLAAIADSDSPIAADAGRELANREDDRNNNPFDADRDDFAARGRARTSDKALREYDQSQTQREEAEYRRTLEHLTDEDLDEEARLHAGNEYGEVAMSLLKERAQAKDYEDPLREGGEFDQNIGPMTRAQGDKLIERLATNSHMSRDELEKEAALRGNDNYLDAFHSDHYDWLEAEMIAYNGGSDTDNIEVGVGSGNVIDHNDRDGLRKLLAAERRVDGTSTEEGVNAEAADFYFNHLGYIPDLENYVRAQRGEKPKGPLSVDDIEDFLNPLMRNGVQARDNRGNVYTTRRGRRAQAGAERRTAGQKEAERTAKIGNTATKRARDWDDDKLMKAVEAPARGVDDPVKQERYKFEAMRRGLMDKDDAYQRFAANRPDFRDADAQKASADAPSAPQAPRNEDRAPEPTPPTSTLETGTQQDELPVPTSHPVLGGRGQRITEAEAAEEMYGTNSPEHHRAKVTEAKEVHGDGSPEHEKAKADAAKPRPKPAPATAAAPTGEQGTLPGVENSAASTVDGDRELPGIDAVTLSNPDKPKAKGGNPFAPKAEAPKPKPQPTEKNKGTNPFAPEPEQPKPQPQPRDEGTSPFPPPGDTPEKAKGTAEAQRQATPADAPPLESTDDAYMRAFNAVKAGKGKGNPLSEMTDGELTLAHTEATKPSTSRGGTHGQTTKRRLAKAIQAERDRRDPEKAKQRKDAAAKEAEQRKKAQQERDEKRAKDAADKEAKRKAKEKADKEAAAKARERLNRLEAEHAKGGHRTTSDEDLIAAAKGDDDAARLARLELDDRGFTGNRKPAAAVRRALDLRDGRAKPEDFTKHELEATIKALDKRADSQARPGDVHPKVGNGAKGSVTSEEMDSMQMAAVVKKALEDRAPDPEGASAPIPKLKEFVGRKVWGKLDTDSQGTEARWRTLVDVEVSDDDNLPNKKAYTPIYEVNGQRVSGAKYMQTNRIQVETRDGDNIKTEELDGGKEGTYTSRKFTFDDDNPAMDGTNGLRGTDTPKSDSKSGQADDLAYGEVYDAMRTSNGRWKAKPDLSKLSDDELQRANKVNNDMRKQSGNTDETMRMEVAIAQEQHRRTAKPDHQPGKPFTEEHLQDGEKTGGDIGTHTITTGSKGDISISASSGEDRYTVSRTIPTGDGTSERKEATAATLDEARTIAKRWDAPEQRKNMEKQAKADRANREAADKERVKKSGQPYTQGLAKEDREVIAKAYPGAGGRKGPDLSRGGPSVRKLTDGELDALSKVRDNLPDHHGEVIDAEIKRRSNAPNMSGTNGLQGAETPKSGTKFATTLEELDAMDKDTEAAKKRADEAMGKYNKDSTNENALATLNAQRDYIDTRLKRMATYAKSEGVEYPSQREEREGLEEAREAIVAAIKKREADKKAAPDFDTPAELIDGETTTFSVNGRTVTVNRGQAPAHHKMLTERNYDAPDDPPAVEPKTEYSRDGALEINNVADLVGLDRPKGAAGTHQRGKYIGPMEHDGLARTTATVDPYSGEITVTPGGDSVDVDAVRKDIQRHLDSHGGATAALKKARPGMHVSGEKITTDHLATGIRKLNPADYPDGQVRIDGNKVHVGDYTVTDHGKGVYRVTGRNGAPLDVGMKGDHKDLPTALGSVENQAGPTLDDLRAKHGRDIEVIGGVEELKGDRLKHFRGQVTDAQLDAIRGRLDNLVNSGLSEYDQEWADRVLAKVSPKTETKKEEKKAAAPKPMTFKQYVDNRNRAIAKKNGISLAEVRRDQPDSAYEAEYGDSLVKEFNAGADIPAQHWNSLDQRLQLRLLRTPRALKDDALVRKYRAMTQKKEEAPPAPKAGTPNNPLREKYPDTEKYPDPPEGKMAVSNKAFKGRMTAKDRRYVNDHAESLNNKDLRQAYMEARAEVNESGGVRGVRNVYGDEVIARGMASPDGPSKGITVSAPSREKFLSKYDDPDAISDESWTHIEGHYRRALAGAGLPEAEVDKRVKELRPGSAPATKTTPDAGAGQSDPDAAPKNPVTGHPIRQLRQPANDRERRWVAKVNDPDTSFGERRDIRRDLVKAGIDYRSDEQLAVEAAQMAYKPTAREKKPTSPGLFANERGVWGEPVDLRLGDSRKGGSEDDIDYVYHPNATGTYHLRRIRYQKNGEAVLMGKDLATGKDVKLKTENGQIGPLRSRFGTLYSRTSEIRTPQQYYAKQGVDQKYPPAHAAGLDSNTPEGAMAKAKHDMAMMKVRQNPASTEVPTVTDEEVHARAEQIGKPKLDDWHSKNKAQKPRILKPGERGTGGGYTEFDALREGSDGTIYDSASMLHISPEYSDPDEIKAQFDANPDLMVDDWGTLFRPDEVRRFGYGIRLKGVDSEGKSRTVKIEKGNHNWGVRTRQPLTYADGTAISRADAESIVDSRWNAHAASESLRFDADVLYRQKVSTDERLRQQEILNSGTGTPAAPSRPRGGHAPEPELPKAPTKHVKGQPFTAEHLEEGETLQDSGSIIRGDYSIISRDDGYSIMEQFGAYRLSRTKLKTPAAVRKRVDAMQKARDAKQAETARPRGAFVADDLDSGESLTPMGGIIRGNSVIAHETDEVGYPTGRYRVNDRGADVRGGESYETLTEARAQADAAQDSPGSGQDGIAPTAQFPDLALMDVGRLRLLANGTSEKAKAAQLLLDSHNA